MKKIILLIIIIIYALTCAGDNRSLHAVPIDTLRPIAARLILKSTDNGLAGNLKRLLVGEYNIVERESVLDGSLGTHRHALLYIVLFTRSIKENGLKIDINIMNLRTGKDSDLSRASDFIGLGILDKEKVKLTANGPYSKDTLNSILDLIEDFLQDTDALKFDDREEYVNKLDKIAASQKNAIRLSDDSPQPEKEGAYLLPGSFKPPLAGEANALEGGMNAVQREIIVENSLGIHVRPSTHLSKFAKAVKAKGLKIDIGVMRLLTQGYSDLSKEFKLITLRIKDEDSVMLSAKGPYNEGLLNEILDIVEDFMHNTDALDYGFFDGYTRRLEEVAAREKRARNLPDGSSNLKIGGVNISQGNLGAPSAGWDGTAGGEFMVKHLLIKGHNAFNLHEGALLKHHKKAKAIAAAA